jgi:hypothetical protein
VLSRCPICLWKGHEWRRVESRPNVYENKSCPQCGGYPRDRITFVLLQRLLNNLAHKQLVIGEIGGSIHSYSWKKTLYRYWNADTRGANGEYVDVWIHACRLQQSPPCADAAILSYVLSEIESKSLRVRLMKELHRFTTSQGRLILFDDLDLRGPKHRVHAKGTFFHLLQLGRPILAELKEAGWLPTVVNSVDMTRIQAELELPFILAAKQRDLALEHWAMRGGKT